MSTVPRSKSKVRRNRPDDDSAEQDSAHVVATSSDKRQSEQYEARKLARRGLRIGRTSVGKGVFATRKIFDGTCIGEIEGQVILDDSYESRYSFDLEDGAQLEPSPPFRYVNHSCEPNCAFELISISSETENSSVQTSASKATAKHATTVVAAVVPLRRKLLLFAICDIEMGDELSIDYNWPATYAIRCQCKSPSCRGWIVNPKHLTKVN